MSKKARLWSMVGVLLVFFGLATAWLNRPFIGHHDWVNILYANSAYHYQNDGYLYHYGMVSQNLPQYERGFYRSMPPTMAMLVSLWTEATGLTEASLRLYNVFISLLSISVLFRFTSRLLGARVGLLAAGLFATCPMVIYFATVTQWEVAMSLIVLLLFYAYWLWGRTGQARYSGAMLVLAFVGIWYFSFMAWVLLFLFLHSLVFANRRAQWLTFGVGVVGAVGLGLWVLHVTEGFNPQVIEAMQNHLQYRSSTVAGQVATADESFTAWQYLGTLGFRLLYGTSLFLLILAAVGAYRLYRGGPNRPQTSLLAVYVVAGLIHLNLWRNSTYKHDFTLYILIMPLAIWAAYGLATIWDGRRGLVPHKRSQRLADGAVMGHVIIMLAVVNFLASFGNDPVVWLSEAIEARSQPESQVGTDLPFVGPHLEYYSHRRIDYALDLANQLDYDLFITCDENFDEQTASTSAHIDEVETCFFIRPNP